MFPRNPIAGFSDGEAQRAMFREQYKTYARRELQSSLSTSQKRRSKRARLEEQRLEAEQLKAESMATLMRQTRHYAHPNEYAQKQRFQYSKGTLHKSDSHEALHPTHLDDKRPYDNLQSNYGQGILLLNRRQMQEPAPKVG